MKTKILYEIRKYEKEVPKEEFKWSHLKAGYVSNDDNIDCKIQTFENEEDARERFKDCKNGASSELQFSTGKFRFVFEYEFRKVKYIFDENDEIRYVNILESKSANYSDRVKFNRDVKKELLKRLDIYADSFEELVEELKSLDCKLLDYDKTKEIINRLRFCETCRFECIYGKDEYQFEVRLTRMLGFEDFKIVSD